MAAVRWRRSPPASLGAPVRDAAGRCGDHPWCDTSLSPDRRADLLLDALTPTERIALLGGDASSIAGVAGTHTGVGDGVPRVGLPSLYLTDGPVGVRQGPSTALPSSLALAASFDLRQAAAHGGLVGDEARLKGNDVVYGPTVNLLRTPLWGRAFESFGEDPFLTAQLGVAWIRSLQARGVLANVKHFAVNNQEGRREADGATAGSRFKVDARVDERTLHELYLPQFEAAVKRGRAASVMCSYNRLNGPHACESEALLDRILRRDWGFKGFVLADYGASKHVDTGLRAGLDFEPFPYLDFDGGENYTPADGRRRAGGGTHRPGARRPSRAPSSCARCSPTASSTGPPTSTTTRGSTAPKHERDAQRLAEAGIVLLKNDRRAAARPAPAALAGGDRRRRRRLSKRRRLVEHPALLVRDAAPCDRGPRRRAASTSATTRGGPRRRRRGRALGRRRRRDRGGQRGRGRGQAVPGPGLRRRGRDGALRRDRLVERVAAANPHTTVVLETAGPVLTPWRDRVEGIVEAWYPGESGGPAIARVLFGDVDPGGRLPATFPRRERDLPTAGNPRRYPGVGDVVRYSEGVLVGYRWYDRRRIRPAFPFGFGLSYTRFGFQRPARAAARPRDRRARLARGHQQGTAHRSGGAAALPRPARRARPAPAAAPAQGLRLGHAAPGAARARRLPARPPRLLLLERAPSSLGGRPRLLPGCDRALLATARPARDDRRARRALPRRDRRRAALSASCA